MRFAVKDRVSKKNGDDSLIVIPIQLFMQNSITVAAQTALSLGLWYIRQRFDETLLHQSFPFR
jgi:hypothetical protein